MIGLVHGGVGYLLFDPFGQQRLSSRLDRWMVGSVHDEYRSLLVQRVAFKTGRLLWHACDLADSVSKFFKYLGSGSDHQRARAGEGVRAYFLSLLRGRPGADGASHAAVATTRGQRNFFFDSFRIPVVTLLGKEP